METVNRNLMSFLVILAVVVVGIITVRTATKSNDELHRVVIELCEATTATADETNIRVQDLETLNTTLENFILASAQARADDGDDSVAREYRDSAQAIHQIKVRMVPKPDC